MKIMILLFCMITSFTGFSQNSTKPCSTPEASQFDFWLGEWDLTWNDTVHGSNRIEKIFGNCTVQENFSDEKGNYLGKSWSVYNSNYKIWEQTWVDNMGGYTQVSGRMSGDSMILLGPEKTVPASISPTGKLKNRMVYYNIQPNSFTWSWESSTDGGLTWKPKWVIFYERKGKK